MGTAYQTRAAFWIAAVCLLCIPVAMTGQDRPTPAQAALIARTRDVSVLRDIIALPDKGVLPRVRADVIRLAGELRPSDAALIAYLTSHVDFNAYPGEAVFGIRGIVEALPVPYHALPEIGLPATRALVAHTAEPIPQGIAYMRSGNGSALCCFTASVGTVSLAVLAFARDAAPDAATQAALSAAIVEVSGRRLGTHQERVAATFDLPEPYKLYPDSEELKQALLSEDDATRHAALSGVLRTYKEHAKALTDLIAAEGPAELEVIEAIGQLRPRQEEAVQAVLGELLETVRHDPMDGKHEEALVTALAKIGCPGVRACVNLLKTEEDKRVEKACVRVLWFALGQFGDDWLLAEAQYGDRHQDYAEKLTAVAERWKRLFKGGGIWNLS